MIRCRKGGLTMKIVVVLVILIIAATILIGWLLSSTGSAQEKGEKTAEQAQDIIGGTFNETERRNICSSKCFNSDKDEVVVEVGGEEVTCQCKKYR
ncbi:MAG: hypothetical protein SVV03_02175 [Candidatus Nanohaloarchaea archaeon]|nr:hypothetical protein [Candidatus Nanohaloarchaea archaeon]